MGKVLISGRYPKEYYDAIVKDGNAYDTNKKWMSQPRSSNDNTQEVLTFTFASASKIDAIDVDLLKVGATYIFEYQTSKLAESMSDKWLPILKDNGTQLSFSISSESDWNSWSHWHFDTKSTIAKRIRIRSWRIDDDLSPNKQFSIGIKNLLLQKVVKSRQDATLLQHEDKDMLGNLVSEKVEDFDAQKAIDSSDITFWKSEVFPDQHAVANMYVDIRKQKESSYSEFEPQYFDSIDIDPVASGSMMTIYASNDDSTGKRNKVEFTPCKYHCDGEAKTIRYDDKKLTWSGIELATQKLSVALQQTSMSYSSPFFVGTTIHVDKVSDFSGIKVNFIPVNKNETNFSYISFMYDAKKPSASASIIDQNSSTPNPLDIMFKWDISSDNTIDGKKLQALSSDIVNADISLAIGFFDKECRASIKIVSRTKNSTSEQTYIWSKKTKENLYVSQSFASGKDANISKALDIPQWATRVISNIEYKTSPSFNENAKNKTYVSFSSKDQESNSIRFYDFIRTTDELNLNPSNDSSHSLIGAIGENLSDVFDEVTKDNSVSLVHGDNSYNAADWIRFDGKRSYRFDWIERSCDENGKTVDDISDIECVLVVGERRYVSQSRQKKSYGNGWNYVTAKVTVDAATRGLFGHVVMNERSFNSNTQIARLHVKALPIGDSDGTSTATIERSDLNGNTTFKLDCGDNVESIAVKPHIYASAFRSDIAGFGGQLDIIPNGTCLLQDIVVLKSDNTAMLDKYISDSKTFVEPNALDETSTLIDNVIFADFRRDIQVYGCIPASDYETKIWQPILIAQKVEKGRYTIPNPVKCKYVKFEFSNLTPMQYDSVIDNDYVTCLTFPEWADSTQTTYSVKNDKQSVISNNSSKDNYYSALNTPREYSMYSNSYENGDIEPYDVNAPRWMPAATNDEYSSYSKEKTSGIVYVGPSEYESKSDTVQGVVDSCIYEAQASDTLISIARSNGIDDWYDKSLSFKHNVDDKNSFTKTSARIPGYWMLPGQKQSVTVSEMQSLASDSTAIAYRTSSYGKQLNITSASELKPKTEESDTRYFAGKQRHHYIAQNIRRKSSIGYCVAIRSIAFNSINHKSERDNVAWNFWSPASSIWHRYNSYITDKDVLVSGQSDDESYAETDIMHSQSYYRTVKLLGINNDSLSDITYFDLKDTVPWHGADYWKRHKEEDVVWDDMQPDFVNDSGIAVSGSGGSWDSSYFTWGDIDYGTVVYGKQDDVMYNEELVKHIKVSENDVRYDSDGNQVPLTVDIGEIGISMNAFISIGASLFSLAEANPGSNKKLETRLQLTTSDKTMLIDEPIAFDDKNMLNWQDFETSYVKISQTVNKAHMYIQFNNFKQLDLFVKGCFIRKGTMRILMKNVASLPYEDVSNAIGRLDGEYTFKTIGNDLQIKVELVDPQDWFAQLIVIPLYIPQEDCINVDSPVALASSELMFIGKDRFDNAFQTKLMSDLKIPVCLLVHTTAGTAKTVYEDIGIKCRNEDGGNVTVYTQKQYDAGLNKTITYMMFKGTGNITLWSDYSEDGIHSVHSKELKLQIV